MPIELWVDAESDRDEGTEEDPGSDDEGSQAGTSRDSEPRRRRKFILECCRDSANPEESASSDKGAEYCDPDDDPPTPPLLSIRLRDSSADVLTKNGVIVILRLPR
jgi:hypothetical protein